MYLMLQIMMVYKQVLWKAHVLNDIHIIFSALPSCRKNVPHMNKIEKFKLQELCVCVQSHRGVVRRQAPLKVRKQIITAKVYSQFPKQKVIS